MKKRVHVIFDLDNPKEKEAYDKLKSFQNEHMTTLKAALSLLILNSSLNYISEEKPKKPAPQPNIEKSLPKNVTPHSKVEVENQKSSFEKHTQKPVEPPVQPQKEEKIEPVQPKPVVLEKPEKASANNKSNVEVINNIDARNRMKNMSDKEKLRDLLKSSVTME